jgi:hypothetical protein
MKTKKCSHCKCDKDLTSYSKSKVAKDGLQSNCKQCATGVAKNWYAKNIVRPEVHARMRDYYKERQRDFKEIVDSIKTKLGCLKCAESTLCCMDFHHVEGKKNKEISWLIKTKNKPALLAELVKCVCICSNCHRKIHAGLIVLSDEEVKIALIQIRSLVVIDPESF